MTPDTLAIGKSLELDINSLQTQKKYWENSKGFYSTISINSRISEDRDFTDCRINADFVDFEVVRALALSKINKIITDKLNEFAAL